MNLPETRSGRWGEGLTTEKMAECRWLNPVLVASSSLWSGRPNCHLRHARFVALREDKTALEVRRI